MQTLYKLRFIPLVFGIITLVVGFGIKILFPPTDSFRIIYYGTLVTFLGFFFLQAMRQIKKEEVEEKNNPKQSESEKEQEMIESIRYNLKNEIPFLAVRAFLMLCLGLQSISTIIYNDWKVGILFLLISVPLFLIHIYWIRKNILALRNIEHHNKMNHQEPVIIKEIEIRNFDRESPIIQVFDNDTSYLLFEFFPPEINKLSKEQINNFDAILSKIAGVKVLHEDRERFLIDSNQETVINKIISFLNTLEVISYDNMIELTKILTNNDKTAISDLTMLAKDKNKFCKNHKEWCEDFSDYELLIFAYWLVGYDTNCKFGAYIDWKEETEDILFSLEPAIKNLGYPLDLNAIEFNGEESTEEALKVINNYFIKQGYTLITLDTQSDSYHLFIAKLEDFNCIEDLGNEIGFSFSNKY